MSQQFDAAVLIGRFQPFHNGHAALLAQALASAGRVMVVLGSAHHARSARNPFTWQERAAMIGATLSAADQARVDFLPMRDYWDDARWATAVQATVKANSAAGQRVALIGYHKDASSAYLDRFPDWDFIAAPQHGEIDATALRKIYFEIDDGPAQRALLAGLVPAAVADYLRGWAALPAYAAVREEHTAVEESRRVWGNGPFITVDAVVKAGGHVLLVRRGQAPGKDQWALPGGFLEPRERVLQGAMRELREETGLGMLDSMLEGSLSGTAVFDHPDRSSRGRNITHAHFFDLHQDRLPDVAGADDAAEARWTPIAALAEMEEQFFEDHFNILNHFLQVTR